MTVLLEPTTADLTDLHKELREARKDCDWDLAERHEGTYKALVDLLEPTYLGPTWEADEDDHWVLPEHTLGWQIIEWCAEYVNALTEGEEDVPWSFTLEQARFLLWWYAIDSAGRFSYRTGVLQRLKGWGKDPLLAVICLVEFVGPCRFSHWEDDEPVGMPNPHAWVQICAVSKTQTDNTMTLFPSLISDKMRSDYNITSGVELMRANHGRQRLQSVTSNPRTLEGARSTFVVLNEVHHWVSGNNGHKMYETIMGNVTKSKGGAARALAITNAYLPGEDSVGERMREAYNYVLEGRAADTGWLYDSIEAHAKTPLTAEALEVVVPKIRGDAYWLDVTTIVAGIQDVMISAARSRRMWLNQIVADEESLYSLDQLQAVTHRGEALEKGDTIVLGFDGSKSRDASALIAIRVRDRKAFLVGLWEKPDGEEGVDWQVPRDRVDSRVHEMFALYDVKGFYADVNQWESYIAKWSETYGGQLEVTARGPGTPIAWDMRRSLKELTFAHERLMQTIFDEMILIDDHRSLMRHITNARRSTNEYGVYFTKESRESPKRVDAYAALLLAHEALTNLPLRGKPKPTPHSGRVWFL